MITGTLTRNDDDTFTATVSTLLFDVARIAVLPNPHKPADNHPNHHLEVRTPRGRAMRVGAMWCAIGERSGRACHSLTLTDRMGRTWRMNAVRGEDAPESLWRIVPLAGGEPEPVALAGRIETLDDGNLAGALGGYDFDLDSVGSFAGGGGEQPRFGLFWLPTAENRPSMRRGCATRKLRRELRCAEGRPISRSTAAIASPRSRHTRPTHSCWQGLSAGSRSKTQLLAPSRKPPHEGGEGRGGRRECSSARRHPRFAAIMSTRFAGPTRTPSSGGPAIEALRRRPAARADRGGGDRRAGGAREDALDGSACRVRSGQADA